MCCQESSGEGTFTLNAFYSWKHSKHALRNSSDNCLPFVNLLVLLSGTLSSAILIVPPKVQGMRVPAKTLSFREEGFQRSLRVLPPLNLLPLR